MKFYGDRVQFSPYEAMVLGPNQDQIITFDEVAGVILRADALLTEEVEKEIKTLEAFGKTGESLEGLLLDPTVASFESWEIGRILLTLNECINDIFDEKEL